MAAGSSRNTTRATSTAKISAVGLDHDPRARRRGWTAMTQITAGVGTVSSENVTGMM